MTSETITIEITPWRLHWRGGRLADVTHCEYGDDRAIDSVQVGAYDWPRGRLVREPDEGALVLVLREWIDGHAGEYIDNVLRYWR